MALERIIERVAKWLSGTVRRVPDTSGGPATVIQVCADAKRAAGSVVALIELGGTETDSAYAIAQAVAEHADGVTSRGATFYLYALNASEKVLLAAFPVKVVPGDVDAELVAVTSSGPSSGATAPLVGDVVTRTVLSLLVNERGHAGELARQNLDTLRTSADVLASVQALQGKTAEILQQQANALLEQLRLAHERAAELATALRAAEKERDEFRRQAGENLALAEQAIDRAEKFEKDRDDREKGPIAELKKKLVEQLAKVLLPVTEADTSSAAISADGQVNGAVSTDAHVNGVATLADALKATDAT